MNGFIDLMMFPNKQCTLPLANSRRQVDMADKHHSATARIENATGDEIAEVNAFVFQPEKNGSFDLSTDPEHREHILKNAAFLFFKDDSSRYKLKGVSFCDLHRDFQFHFDCQRI